MIVTAVVVLLVILIISNLVLGVYNMLYPPCSDINDYFTGAKRLPDGSVASLGSIPSGTDKNYVGAARVSTGKPGVIGLTSYNKSYIDPNSNSIESMKNPMFADDELHEDEHDEDDEELDDVECDESSCTLKPSKVNYKAYDPEDAISAMFPTSSQKQGGTKKATTEVAGYYAQFDMEMEGIGAPIYSKNTKRHKPISGFSKSLERDGYQDDDSIDDSRDNL